MFLKTHAESLCNSCSHQCRKILLVFPLLVISAWKRMSHCSGGMEPSANYWRGGGGFLETKKDVIIHPSREFSAQIKGIQSTSIPCSIKITAFCCSNLEIFKYSLKKFFYLSDSINVRYFAHLFLQLILVSHHEDEYETSYFRRDSFKSYSPDHSYFFKCHHSGESEVQML